MSRTTRSSRPRFDSPDGLRQRFGASRRAVPPILVTGALVAQGFRLCAAKPRDGETRRSVAEAVSPVTEIANETD
jgi:hypothetical protein